MTINFQELRQRVNEMGEHAPQRERTLSEKRELARQTLDAYTHDIEALQLKLAQVRDPFLRCALPGDDTLTATHTASPLPHNTTLIAADGSQIELDHHAEVEFCLVNLGAIQLCTGCGEPPHTTIQTTLQYENLEEMNAESLALQRDLGERRLLAELAMQAPPPVIAFTDGPLELWGAKDTQGGFPEEYKRSLDLYLDLLNKLCLAGVTFAGYIDKPVADLMVRLLEVALAEGKELAEIKQFRPLRGVRDRDLFNTLLAPSERSAVFPIQSSSAKFFKDDLRLHFFYINVGRPGHPWLARVEVPGWVAGQADMLEALHAALLEQCRVMGARPYPYLLHRAHETAVVSLDEKEQVTQMIALELRKRGVEIQGISHKQAAKDLERRRTSKP